MRKLIISKFLCNREYLPSTILELVQLYDHLLLIEEVNEGY